MWLSGGVHVFVDALWACVDGIDAVDLDKSEEAVCVCVRVCVFMVVGRAE